MSSVPNSTARDLVTGWRKVEAINLKRIDDYTIETVAKKAGQRVMTTRSVVSKDGRTRTSTEKGKTPKGQDVKNTLVYSKQ